MMFMNKFLSGAAAFTAAAALFLATTSTHVQAQQDQQYVCTFSDPVSIHYSDLVQLQYVKNEYDNTFTMRVTYLGGQSWIGIGINTAGRSGMTPAEAVIGRFLDSGESSVLRYDLQSDSRDASGVVPMSSDLQNLQDAVFMQTSEKSVLEFTQPLDGLEDIITDNAVWIFAVGLDGNQWAGKHQIDGSFYLELGTNTNCQPSSSSSTNVDSSTTTTSDTTATTTNPDTTTSTTTTGSGTADSTTSTGNTATEGEYENEQDNEDEDHEYEGDNDSDDGSSGASPVLVGDSSSSSSSSTSNSGIVTSTSAESAAAEEQTMRTLWLVHGWTLMIGWAICAPIAIGCALLRKMRFLNEKGNWYKMHYYCTMMTVLLTIIGFIVAVVATQMDGDEHFIGDEPHKKVGLAIFIIVLIQAIGGYFRPNLPKAATTGNNSMPNKEDSGPESDSEEAMEQAQPSQSVPPPSKSSVRMGWEICHRIFGMMLLGLAWYNCYEGFEIVGEDFGPQYDYSKVLWGLVGAIGGTIAVGMIVLRSME